NNYLVALGRARGAYALAWADISTGEFRVMDADPASLEAELVRLQPGEILVSPAVRADPALAAALDPWAGRISQTDPGLFDSSRGLERVKHLFGLAAVDALGDEPQAAAAACGAILAYLEETQVQKLPRLAAPERQAATGIMLIDGSTRRNLELVETLSGQRAGSLLSVIDRTVTGPGGRLLAARLSAPLTEPAAINARLDAVGYFVDDAAAARRVRDILRRAPDMERALSRLSVARGGPRDLAA